MNRYSYPTFKRPKITSEFMIGDRVKYATAFNPVRGALRGTVTKILSPVKVMVTWDSNTPFAYDEWNESLIHE